MNILAGLALSNPHIDFYDFSKRGYGVIEATKTGLTCELKAVNATTPTSRPACSPSSPCSPGTRFRSASRNPA